MSRRRLQDAGLGVNLSLIITPMLDMAFQLMAFFIMTFQPLSQEENIVGVLLPPAREEVKKKQKKEEKKEKEKGKGPATDKDKEKEPESPKDKDKKKETKDEGGKEDVDPDLKDEPIPKDVYVEVKTPGNENAATQNPWLKGKPGRIEVRYFVLEDAGWRSKEVADDILERFERTRKKPFANQAEFDEEYDKAFRKSVEQLFAFLDDPPKSARDNKTPLIKKSDTSIQVVVPPGLHYGYFIQVQDAARGARYNGVGFAKPVRPKK